MASYINSGFSVDFAGFASPVAKIIPLNRWSRCCYTLQVDTGGEVELQGTLTQLNRRDRVTGVAPTPVWFVLNDDAGDPIEDQGAGIVRTSGYALEAFRVLATDAISTGRVMQQGETD